MVSVSAVHVTRGEGLQWDSSRLCSAVREFLNNGGRFWLPQEVLNPWQEHRVVVLAGVTKLSLLIIPLRHLQVGKALLHGGEILKTPQYGELDRVQQLHETSAYFSSFRCGLQPHVLRRESSMSVDNIRNYPTQEGNQECL